MATNTIGPEDSFEDAYKSLRPGDTLLLAEGSYWGRRRTNRLPENGTADNPITIAAAPGANVVLTPYDGSRHQVWAISEQWLVLDGLTLDGRVGGIQYGLKLCEGAGHIVVRNCKFTNFRINYVKLIGMLGDDAASGPVLFDGCEFWEDVDTPQNNLGRFFDSVNFSDITIRNSHFHDAYYKGGNGAIVLKGGSDRCVIEECFFARITQPGTSVSWPYCVISVGGESTPGHWDGGHESVGSVIRECEFVECGNGGILLFSARDCMVEGNDIECGGNYGIALHGPGNEVALDCADNTIRDNNITYRGSPSNFIRDYGGQSTGLACANNRGNGELLPDVGGVPNGDEPEPGPIRFCPFQAAWRECQRGNCMAWSADGSCQRI